jgi:hypothetical protein
MKGYELVTALDTKIDELGGVVITYGEQPDAADGSKGATGASLPFFCPALSPTPHRGRARRCPAGWPRAECEGWQCPSRGRTPAVARGTAVCVGGGGTDFFLALQVEYTSGSAVVRRPQVRAAAHTPVPRSRAALLRARARVCARRARRVRARARAHVHMRARARGRAPRRRLGRARARARDALTH